MQFKLFTIPIHENEKVLAELNRFLRANKVLDVQQQLVSNKDGAHWCFSIRYGDTSSSQTSYKKAKVDYRQVLDEADFQKFSKLRVIRKKVAAHDGVPAYAVFTDEELANLAELDVITPKNMLTIKGIGDKKIERYAKYFISRDDDETTGTSD